MNEEDGEEKSDDPEAEETKRQCNKPGGACAIAKRAAEELQKAAEAAVRDMEV